MIPVITVLSYKELTALIKSINFQPSLPVQIVIHDVLLNDAVVLARNLEQKNEVDVFLSAGSNATLVTPQITTPLVNIKITGFDVLLALKKAKSHTNRVGIVSYQEKIPFLSDVKDIISLEITEASYTQAKQIEPLLADLLHKGINTVIGGSLVIEVAHRLGMKGLLLYSPDGIIRAFESAVQIAYSKRKELEKTLQLRAILDFAYSGIIATDNKGQITVFNPCAEKITGIAATDAIGNSVQRVLPTTRMLHILNNGQPEYNKIQSIGNTQILTNRIPIIINDAPIGTVATFQDVKTVQESEVQIRKKLYTKGFVAKTHLADLVGNTPSFHNTKQAALKYAANDLTILINGESGTGKEMFAQGIHNASARSKYPFVAVNCAAITESLLESELFGYEEGAFTGAKKGGKHGLFELAHQGTIFLDEIGEIPVTIQARLLRVLEQKEVMRIGGDKIIPVNIKIIGATNKNLKDLVEQGTFRNDLYYRLNVLELKLPPLRDRQLDIQLFVKRFLSELRPDFSKSTLDKISLHSAFTTHTYPGNIRELKNIIERFSVLYSDDQDYNAMLSTIILGHDSPSIDFTPDNLEHILKQYNGNRAKVAKALGISRMTLWRKLKNKK